jgi:hemolysin III
MNPFFFREPMNAWSHCSWLLLSLPATVLLCRRSRGDLAKQRSLIVFGVSLAVCYGGSTLFHGVHVSDRELLVYNLLDYIGIYVLIAGSYTPLAWNLLRGAWRSCTLILAWTMAVTGAAAHLAFGMLPMSVATVTYLIMGWGAIFCYFEIAREHTHRRLRWIWIGGVFYTVGAVINLLQWPNFWPGVLGWHETFHLFAMAGSLSHFWFMLTVVAPPRLNPVPVPIPARVEPSRRAVA